MNQLYPIFLKADQLRILIVGSGEILLEKVTALLEQSPNAKPEIISLGEDQDTIRYLEKFPGIRITRKEFQYKDLQQRQILILATRNRLFSEKVTFVARKAGILVNAADMPDLCDFYLCSVLRKGNLKLGISTNGHSPILAKRIREYFDDVIPAETEDLINNLHSLRNKIKGDLRTRAEKLNRLTCSFVGETTTLP